MPYSGQVYLEIRNLLQSNDGAEDAPAFAEQVVADAVAAIESRNWDRLNPLLYPYLHWTGADGETCRGRTRVLRQLASSPSSGSPVRYKFRDGQIYRWSQRPAWVAGCRQQ